MSTLKTHNLQSPDAGSVNIVMAPNAGMVVAGLSTYSNQINVGSNIKLGTAGVVTATSFSGSGANLTSLPSQLTLSNNADNRVITGGSGTNLNGEATLTYGGTELLISNASPSVKLNDTDNSGVVDINNVGGAAVFQSTGDALFETNGSERLRIGSNGYVNIGTGTAEEQLTIRNTSQHCLIRIISGNASGVSAGIDFGDADDSDVGRIRYYHDNNYMRFDTSAGERMRITDVGQLLVGTTSSGANVRAVFQGYNGGGENFQARVQFQTNQATNLSTNHHLANLLFTNASNSVGAEIRVQADEAWGTNDYPTRISFLTTPNGSATRSERLIIKNDGIVNIGVSSPQYAKKVNIQGGNDATLSLSNQDYTGYAAGSQSGIEGRLQCGGGVWSTSGIRFKKFNGTSGDKHTTLELYATDGYSNKTGLVIQPDGEVTKPLTPSFQATRSGAGVIQIASNAGADIIFTSEEWDVGSNYNNSNGRFTAPVAGKYFFGIQLYLGFSVTAVRVMHSYFGKNGSSNQKVDLCGGINSDGGTHYHPTATGSCLMSLAVGDYVTFNIGSPSFSGSGNSYLYDDSRFFGYLVG